MNIKGNVSCKNPHPHSFNQPLISILNSCFLFFPFFFICTLVLVFVDTANTNQFKRGRKAITIHNISISCNILLLLVLFSQSDKWAAPFNVIFEPEMSGMFSVFYYIHDEIFLLSSTLSLVIKLELLLLDL